MRKLFSFLVIILLLLSAVFFITCKKEFSYEGGGNAVPSGGTAIYAFVSDTGACSNSILSGNYYAGVALTDSDAVQLWVKVDSAGTYVINTNSANGIYFSGSGAFADTGIQAITLQGIGKPASEGSFTYTTPGNTNCRFLVTVTAEPKPVASFVFTGAPDACADFLVNGEYVAGRKLSLANTVNVNVNVTEPGAYTIKSDTLDGIYFSSIGTFTKTGNQLITLFGTGTPELPRNLAFRPAGSNTACTFNLSVNNPPPLAAYVLESGSVANTNPCIASVSGNYVVNTILSPANIISLRVTVLMPGNFTIATNEVNGMLFSYTGTFTAEGAQEVVLKGSGTPLSPGTFTFIPMIVGPHPYGGEACAVEVEVR